MGQQTNKANRSGTVEKNMPADHFLVVNSLTNIRSDISHVTAAAAFLLGISMPRKIFN